jgi:hypothetical protein
MNFALKWLMPIVQFRLGGLARGNLHFHGGNARLGFGFHRFLGVIELKGRANDRPRGLWMFIHCGLKIFTDLSRCFLKLTQALS